MTVVSKGEMWPDIEMTPPQLRRVTALLRPKIEGRMLEEHGLLELARSNGRMVIEKMIPPLANIKIEFNQR
jgi:hypothetical protein